MEKIPQLDFSKTGNDNVVLLMFATYERCFWLCWVCWVFNDSCVSCPGRTVKALLMGDDVCNVYNHRKITRLQIRKQCMAELARRGIKWMEA